MTLEASDVHDVLLYLFISPRIVVISPNYEIALLGGSKGSAFISVCIENVKYRRNFTILTAPVFLTYAFGEFSFRKKKYCGIWIP